jgi:hypothetical protein
MNSKQEEGVWLMVHNRVYTRIWNNIYITTSNSVSDGVICSLSDRSLNERSLSVSDPVIEYDLHNFLDNKLCKYELS